MARRRELEPQVDRQDLLPIEFYLYILDQERKQLVFSILKEIQGNPLLVSDRGYSFSKELKKNNINITVSSITYDDSIHIIFSDDSDIFYVVNPDSISELSSKEYLQQFSHIKRTPLISTLFFMEQSLDMETNVENWAESPAIILGHFERVGSTWLMDLVNQFGRSQVEPIRQHVSLNSPVNSFTQSAHSNQIDDNSFHANLSESPYSQIWFRNYLASQFQGELQVSKETNLFFMLPFFLDLFPNNTPIIILRRDIRGILSSFKKGNLFENWEYKDRYQKLKNVIVSNPDLQDFQYIFDTTDETNWIDVLITLYIVNLHQIVTTTLMNNQRRNIATISYEDMVRDRDVELAKVKDLLHLDDADEITEYQTKSESSSEFNTNKKKKNPHDWIEVLDIDEISYIEERISQRFVDIQNIFGDDIANLFVEQGFLVEENDQKKEETKPQKPIKGIVLSSTSQTKEAIAQTMEFIQIPEYREVPHFSISSSLVTNEEFIVFLNEMHSKGIDNDVNGNYLFYNSNILANRGGRIFLSNGEYMVVDGYQQHPVCWVNWIGAKAYAQWNGCIIPSLEQWNSIVSQIPIENDRNSDNLFGDTTPVGFYPRDTYGIYDLYGNLKIWTDTWNTPAEISSNAGLAFSTVGYAWNSRTERGNITYKPYLLSSSTLGIRLVKPDIPISVDLDTSIKRLANIQNSDDFLDNNIFTINEKIKNLLSQ